MPLGTWLKRSRHRLRHTFRSGESTTQDPSHGQDAAPTLVASPVEGSITNTSHAELASGLLSTHSRINLAPLSPLSGRSSFTNATPITRPEQLWDQAYDELKKDEAEIVQAYEKILSSKLRGQDINSPVADFEQNAIAQDNTSERCDQMQKLIRDGLEKTAREAKVKENIGVAVQFVLNARAIISSAVQAMPQAALAWTGACVLLEMLQHPISETEANRKGIEHVIKRMKWYWELSGAFLKKTLNTNDLSGVRYQLEIQIINFYKLLLLYEMKSVCSYYRHRGFVFLRDMVGLDDWKGNMDAIRKAESALSDDFKAYTVQEASFYLGQLVTFQMDEKDRQCLRDLRLTDPSDDKKRIEQTKGGLLLESYWWILDDPDYQEWRDNDKCRLLWIRGDPGKGKTMLLCGIINELIMKAANSSTVSYFFCQATDRDLNNATAVLRGIIYLLIRKHPSLISHVRKRYDVPEGKVFEDANAWVVLSDILADIVQDLTLLDTYLIVDALDECSSGMDQLLDLIKNLSVSSRVKWIVSSRNWPQIEHKLALSDINGDLSLSLEVNADLISNAVDAYIDYKINQLTLIQQDIHLKDQVRCLVRQKANGTFLWVALVVRELKEMEDAEFEDNSEILRHLEDVPDDLTKLYSRMLDQIGRLKNKDPDLCRKVLSTATLVSRPLHLAELAALTGFQGNLADEAKLERLVNKCGSFLTVRNGTVYFVHQSAKDYLVDSETAQGIIFPFGRKAVHYTIFSQSLKAMDNKLHKNMYALPHPGTHNDEFTTPHPDPLASIRYACVYWADHFCNGYINDGDVTHQAYLDDNRIIYSFIENHFLHWLEALSLLRNMSDGILSLSRLETLFRTKLPKGQTHDLLQDAYRFVLYYKLGIENSPLQTYISALIFSPEGSLIRKLFSHQAPPWISSQITAREKHWSSCLQTFECQSGVASVAMSLDGQWVVSGSFDHKIRIWDTTTGACNQILSGHNNKVHSVVISSNKQQIISASWDETIRIWDMTTGTCIHTLEDQDDYFGLSFSLAVSSDGQRLASSDYMSRNIKIWDLPSGACSQIINDAFGWIYSVAISSDGKWVASGSSDEAVKIWDPITGTCLQTLNHTSGVHSVAIFPDDFRVVSGGDDATIRIWDTITGLCTHTLNGHYGKVYSVVISLDGQRIASASQDKTIKIWDPLTRACLQTFIYNAISVSSLAISSNGQRLASASSVTTIRIWDGTADISIETSEGHNDLVSSVAISLDGQWVISGSADYTIRIWDTTIGTCLHILRGHESEISSIAILPNSQQVISGSMDKTVRIWDTSTGMCINTLNHGSKVYAVAASSDGWWIASGLGGGTVGIWDMTTSTYLHTLELELVEPVEKIAISSDGQVVTAACVNKFMIWNTTTGTRLHDIVNDTDRGMGPIAISPNGQRVALSSNYKTIEIWDTITGSCLQALNVEHPHRYLSFDLMPDSCLRLSQGWVDLDLNQMSTPKTQSVEASIPRPCYFGYGIKRGAWVVKDGKPVLWLPPDYRGGKFAIVESTIAIGCQSGRVVILQFSEPTSDW
ncbi:Vegetative incompatibility protein HET-E-1 [Cladobotryum mycophilum]|uniref:Mitochondrial division protein 1 n=1 Tax=Cladobotryum mycophilum TaxID=491253 RepID=A0ABR0SCI7_9HYPO